jgi:MoaA/NifB/PqqE/SkfB family radical SAM enzyme|tara:strand:- start:299 stop:1591 length:1293 start_codon:yes stop_codon:yes gene_type:complete
MENEKLIPAHWVTHANDVNTNVVEDEKWNNLHSDSWCPVPFNTISWHPTGVVSRCMMSDAPMGDSHDSPLMQELRQNMLDNKWDNHGCTNCLKKEQNGNRSQRMNWLHHDFREGLGNPEPYTNPKLTGNDISHLFINFSNICNFKCRMCSSNYSNSLIPEHKHMSPLFPQEYKMVNGSHSKNFNNINEYLEANPEVLKGITSIWMTGGEPFMDDSPYRLMELIEEYGHPEKIKMVITTNGSKLDFKKLDKFNKLKKVILDISIDAVGPMFEYMRSNGVFTWSQMEATCDKLKQYKETNKEWFNFQINSSYQLLNYDNTLDFIDFVYDHNADSNIRLVVFPEHLRAGNLPKSFKKQANIILDKVELRYGNKDQHQIKTLNDMRKALAVNELHFANFKKIVTEQDKFRSKYLYEYHEQLGELLYGPTQQCLF